MLESYNMLLKNLPWISTLIGVVCLILSAWLMNIIFKKVLLKAIQSAMSSTLYGRDKELNKHQIIIRFMKMIPAMVIMWGVNFIPGMIDAVENVISNLCLSFIIFSIARTLSAALNIINTLYCRRSDSRDHSIKGYLELIKIIMYIISTILIISILINRSPVILLSGLGALAAVFMLIFQDTLLSLVASIQISSSDMVRVGDWIEVPHLNADGAVIDIALHTVKVQNWDNTITTLPTRKLITDPFKNWRGMEESGARKIQRSFSFDQNSIHYLSKEELERLKNIQLLKEYLLEKEQEILKWNDEFANKSENSINSRRITNIGSFRAYIEKYLRSHPGVHQNRTLMVRQLAPGANGLSLEIYCFSNNTAWVAYESIQSDIFDHLLTIAPEFGLEIFQNPSGKDLQKFIDSKLKK